MLDPTDAFHDGFHRFRNQLDGIFRFQARCRDMNIHQRNRDLRLFLTWEADKRDQPDGQRRKDHQGRQRGVYERLGQAARDAERRLVRMVTHD